MADEKQIELLERYKELTKSVVELDKQRLRQEGNFVGKKREGLLELKRSLDLQNDLIQVSERQIQIENDRQSLAKKDLEIKKAKQELEKVQFDEADIQQDKLNTLEAERARISEGIERSVEKQKASQEAIVNSLNKGVTDLETQEKNSAAVAEEFANITNNAAGTLERLKDSVEVTEELKDKGTEAQKRFQGISDAASTLFEKTANFFGISTEFSDKFNSIVASFKGANFEDIALRAGAAFKQTFNVINLTGTLLKAFGEQIMEVLKLQVELTGETGLGADVILSFREGKNAANDLAGALMFTNAEAMEAGVAISQSLPIFSSLGKQAIKDITGIGVSLQSVGVDLSNFGSAIQDLAAVTGESFTATAIRIQNLTDRMVEFGISPKEAIQSFAQLQPRLALLGKTGTQVFEKLAIKAKALNVEIEGILDITDLFNTFEEAIPITQSLNAIFGRITGTMGSFFNATELVLEQDPDKRFDMLRASVESTGVSLKNLANGTNEERIALRALSAAMGNMPIDEMVKKFEAANDATVSAIDSQKDFNKIIKESRGFSEMLKATFESIIEDLVELGIDFNEVALSVRNFVVEVVSFIKENPNLSKALMLIPFVTPLIVSSLALATMFATGYANSQLRIAIESNKAAIAQEKQAASAVVAGKSSAAGALGVQALGGAFATLGQRLFMVAGYAAAFVGAFMLFDSIGASLAENMNNAAAAIFGLGLAIILALTAASLGFGGAGIAAGLAAAAAGVVGFKGMVGAYDGQPDATVIGDISNTIAAGGEPVVALARGGTIGPYLQTALVGEEGPEIVTLPPGSSVYSNPESKKISASYALGSGPTAEDFNRSFAGNAAASMSLTMSSPDKALSQASEKSLAKAIAEALEPVLRQTIGSIGGSDVILNGKKVGKQLQPQMTKAFENGMSKRLTGGSR